VERIKQRLQRGELVLAAGVGRLAHHNLIQIIGLHGGFQAIWIDLEHGSLSIEGLEVATLAARSVGLDNFVRLAPTDYALVTRCLESGAGGVMAAQIASAAQAEQFVQWAKFAPRGRRGLNTSGWDARFASLPVAEFCEKANRDTLVAIQIETLGALDQCDQIAAIDGVDLLFVGPADLSQSLGVTGEFFHSKCLEAMDRVAEACRKHEKHWGAVCVSPEHAKQMIQRGCRLLSITNDVRLVHAGLDAVQQLYADCFSAANS